MIEIKKGREPRELTGYKNIKDRPLPTYEDLPHDVKTEVLRCLLEEQGYLCAYCMRRIDESDATIEHIKPQNICSRMEKLDYHNMLAVCPGNGTATNDADKHCDKKRGSLRRELQPFLRLDVFKQGFSSLIQYSSHGTVFSSDDALNEDINLRLNLNCKAALLEKNRAAALQAYYANVNKRLGGKAAPKGFFESEREKLIGQKRKLPYLGVILFWLDKKIAQTSGGVRR